MVRFASFFTFLTFFFIVGVFSSFSFFERVFAASSLFSRDLQVGSVGEDVRNLQKVLNSDLRTRVATTTGPGSLGKESTFFGDLTRRGVLKFQALYANEVLAPLGFSQGTGVVEGFTREKVNEVGERLGLKKPVVPVAPKPKAIPVAPTVNVPPADSSVVFYRDLKVGSVGEDVRVLQELLNTDVRTQVARLGTGSPGNETTYFGELTGEAVAVFQEIFFEEILAPAGLTSGTGIVGPSTRVFLNTVQASLDKTQAQNGTFVNELPNENFIPIFTLPVSPPSPQKPLEQNTQTQNVVDPVMEKIKALQKQVADLLTGNKIVSELAPKTPQAIIPKTQIPQKVETKSTGSVQLQPQETTIATSPTVNISFESSEADPLDVYQASRYDGRPGDIVVLTGSGFLREGNSVRFGNITILDIKTTNSAELRYTVPNVPPGSYSVSVSNRKGAVPASSFRVLNPVEKRGPPPVITRIEPTQTKLGDTITIIGSGFTSTGNTLSFGYAELENLSSVDGKTLKATLPLFETEEGKEGGEVLFGSRDDESAGILFLVYVENNNGFSDGIGFPMRVNFLNFEENEEIVENEVFDETTFNEDSVVDE